MNKRSITSFTVAVLLTAVLSFFILPPVWNNFTEMLLDPPFLLTPDDFPISHKFIRLLITGLFLLLIFIIVGAISFGIMSKLQVDAWEKEEETESEKALNDYLEPTMDLVFQGFKGKRTAIIKEWDDVDTNLEFNINYFLKKFEDKIDVVDQKMYKHKVLIIFKMK